MNAFTTPYSRAWRFALACPLLFAVPAVAEVAQHVVEYGAGFYLSIAAMKAAEHDTGRMVLGHLKVIALYLTGYWATRFWAYGDDARAAWRVDARVAGLYLPVLAWELLWLVVIQDGPVISAALNLPERLVVLIVAILMPATLLFNVCLAAWKATTAVGDGRIGFMRSIELTPGSFWWSLGLTLVTVLPVMVLHYVLAFAALGRSPVVTGGVLLADSLLVAFMAPLLVAVNYAIAERVLGRAGLAIEPEGGSNAASVGPVSGGLA
ncbi:hypothetical protein [Sphingomonas prati]|uniref:Uncharacterized protein n=1 Tax=Sphingomonas prati TaxID=1843237 RepID=A0A7W9BSY7_9SPHN|nr:hypothetical protein [Sphingomonas prati]MBB5729537.1 hypothetical protein [Sphingomonas prati]GGE76677.1 hypothetical protein GCM10011404_06680 [Sphingomonas prati]